MIASLLLPSLNRPRKLKNVLSNIRHLTNFDTVETIVILDEDDTKSQDVTLETGFGFYLTPAKTKPVKKWNLAAEISVGEWLVLLSDDIEFPLDFLDKALATPNFGFLAITDGKPGKQFEPFYMATREWLRKYQNGVLCVPHYKHWGLDVEVCARARRSGTYRLAHGVIFKHFHPAFGVIKPDSTNRIAEKFHESDVALYYERERNNFPDDFEGFL